jgi:N-acyl-D-aspartate/D-glutamate deacylase
MPCNDGEHVSRNLAPGAILGAMIKPAQQPSRVPSWRLLVLILTISAGACEARSEPVDLVLYGGTVVDGTGAPAVPADVAIHDGRIVAVGAELDMASVERIDVSGLVVAPGFIDPHTHSRGRIFEIPTADNFVLQGVTTLVDGNDGSSPWPLGRWLDSLEARGTAPNFALFLGHGTVRQEIMGNADRPPSAEELSEMEAMVAEGMDEGALGLSSGLAYVPGAFAETGEIIALARVAGARGGMYISHMRDEGAGVLASIEETIRIGHEAEIPVQMTHHKVGGHRQFGLSATSIERMREAHVEGVDVTFDQYPYTASSTGLSFLIPAWAKAGDSLQARLEDPQTRTRVLDDMRAFIDERFANDPSRVQLVSCEFDPELAGLTMADALASRERPSNVTAMAELVLEFDRLGGCGAILHSYDEGDVERFLSAEHGMIGSDGRLSLPGEGSPHPRGYGTYPRVLGRYVRERGVISLEEAVRRMTSAPADRLGFRERGRVRVGAVADLVVFDASTVLDQATFQEPHRTPIGIPHVFVGGVAVVRDGIVTDMRPGEVLRGPAWRAGEPR